MNKIAIIGIGNILLQDDGVGIHIVRKLEKDKLFSGVEIVDGGTSTLDMLGYFMDYKKIIIIDSLKSGYKPGTIYKIRPEDIKNYKKENLSIHDVQILDVVKMANVMKYDPEVIIFGIEPKELSMKIGVTDIIEKIIPDIIKHIKVEIENYVKH